MLQCIMLLQVPQSAQVYVLQKCRREGMICGLHGVTPEEGSKENA